MPAEQKKFMNFIQICITITIFYVIFSLLEGGEYILSESVSQESEFQVYLTEDVNYKLWVVDLNGPESTSIRISKGSYAAFEDTFMLMHPEGDYLPYHPKFSVEESGTYRVYIKPMDSGTVRLVITKSRFPKFL
ncbi:hypothetical protein MTHERMMSTA1_03230 [Methanosarcina thermophila MST-A1]|jgi:hypothetical protein|uniref:Uncharacterized protein n=3 Tax=Methanosarcina thermophila TaxID=2210 RepID=A0A3G9CQD1_METTE|nr:hypothetical protein MSTHT_1368 [Methanosarcina thermophila TM-1]ALK04483.1 MAG: hypothetical protein AAY43_00675 [Methanosarcina sp. 795]BAW28116.1 conserved hypothetical protein [Methanosarcina thermophila]GLI13197.1 hypothetical protein MTHERMMSTA1_03230 [Methanosarcina thermophila MST-A1]